MITIEFSFFSTLGLISLSDKLPRCSRIPIIYFQIIFTFSSYYLDLMIVHICFIFIYLCVFVDHRSECSAYVARHGGGMRSSMSKTITHLLNDHGEIGPSKLKQVRYRASTLSIYIIHTYVISTG